MGFFYLLLTFTLSSLFLFLSFISFLILRLYTGKSIKNPHYPPVKGTVFHQLLYFKRLYDHETQIARENPTYRLLAADHSAIYTCDPRNIEHVLKTRFSDYTKGEYNQTIVSDVFGHGIFAVDGDKWRQQRKLASFEFSTRVLRDFSCSVFRRSAARLVRVVTAFSDSNEVFDMQVGKS